MRLSEMVQRLVEIATTFWDEAQYHSKSLIRLGDRHIRLSQYCILQEILFCKAVLLFGMATLYAWSLIA